MKLQSKTEIHRWFAWFPVDTRDGERVWLEMVWRQAEFTGQAARLYGRNYRYYADKARAL